MISLILSNLWEHTQPTLTSNKNIIDSVHHDVLKKIDYISGSRGIRWGARVCEWVCYFEDESDSILESLSE